MKPAPERALPVYTVDEPASVPAYWVVAAVAAPPVGPGVLEALLRLLLPTAPVQTPPHRAVPTEMDILLECLLSGALAPMLTPPSRNAGSGIATGSDSQGLDYGSVFFLWQTGSWGGQVPGIG